MDFVAVYNNHNNFEGPEECQLLRPKFNYLRLVGGTFAYHNKIGISTAMVFFSALQAVDNLMLLNNAILFFTEVI